MGSSSSNTNWKQLPKKRSSQAESGSALTGAATVANQSSKTTWKRGEILPEVRFKINGMLEA